MIPCGHCGSDVFTCVCEPEPALCEREALVFDALWEIVQDHQLEAGPPHSRYAVTGDIVRQMARGAVAALGK